MLQPRRIFGGVLILVGVLGVMLAVAGIVVGQRAVDNLGASTFASLDLLKDSLDTVQETLLLAKDTVADVNTSLETVEETAVTVSQSLRETRPLLGQINTIVSDDAPRSIETLGAAIPDIVQVAAAIDDALTTLDSFRIDRTILGIPLQFDLGITYQPEQPFDETVAALGDSVVALPAQLRTMEIYVNVTSDNLESISGDLNRLAADLQTVNGRIADLGPLLNEYERITTELADRTRIVRANMESQLAGLKTAVVIVCIWLALSQLTTLYVGWELMRGGGVKQ